MKIKIITSFLLFCLLGSMPMFGTTVYKSIYKDCWDDYNYPECYEKVVRCEPWYHGLCEAEDQYFCDELCYS